MTFDNNDKPVSFGEERIVEGHTDWITKIIQCPEKSDLILTSSRDKSIILWDTSDILDPKMITSLHGHNHHVTDMTMSTDGTHIVSSSRDKTLRVWNLPTQKVSHILKGHTGPVFSVALSHSGRQIVSGSMDKTIKLWNILGQCKHTINHSKYGHKHWVSSVRLPPSDREDKGRIISCSWDKTVKIWNNMTCNLEQSIKDTDMYLNTVEVSPDSTLYGSGGKDGWLRLYDLNNINTIKFDTGNEINAICFSPNRYFVCVASGPDIKIYDLTAKTLVHTLSRKQKISDNPKKRNSAKEYQLQPKCICLTWNLRGDAIYAGYTDNNLVIWHANWDDGMNWDMSG
ncbi:Guanine nucleotide-binding protein subunit beta-like protein [Intoshia linei]|uniref:Small ribosomal subunit protein RACK1 n=1 Tax=Intoshia linei TaxID=1819745 RepID=A0A177AV69_9BILA|nr:Guanine nucleotide-binding protein subunit beta-like protein [Intoshia linei]